MIKKANSFSYRLLRFAIASMLFEFPLLLYCQTKEDSKAVMLADPNDYVAHYNLGVKYTLSKLYDSALVEYRNALEIYPRYSEAHYAIYCNEILKDTSLLSELSKETPSSLKAIKVTEIKEHDNIAFYNDPFFDRSMAGLFVKAEVFYKPLEYRVNSNYGITLYLKLDGFNKFFRGEYSSAIGDLTIMIDDSPDFIQGYYLRGLALAHLGWYEDAIADFRRVIEKMEEYNKTKVLPIYLNTSHLQYMIGYAYLQEGRYYPAEAAFKAALEQNLGLFMAQFQLSIVDYLRGSFNPAIEKIDAAIAIKPEDAILHSNKGAMLAQQRRYDEAIAELKMALSIIPRYPSLYLNLARIYESNGKTADAIEQYKRYVSIASMRDSLNIQLAQESITRLTK